MALAEPKFRTCQRPSVHFSYLGERPSGFDILKPDVNRVILNRLGLNGVSFYGGNVG